MSRRFKIKGQTKSIKFDGVDDYIDLGADFIGTGDITYITVIKPLSWGEGDYAKLLDNGKLSITLSITSKSVRIASDNSTFVTAGTNAIKLASWDNFVAITRTSSGIANFRINGVASGTANQNSGTPEAGTTNVISGNNAATTRSFLGSKKIELIFNRILTATEIDNIMYDYIMPDDYATSCTLHLTFDNDTAPTVTSLDSSGKTGTISGATLKSEVPPCWGTLGTITVPRTTATNRLAVRDCGFAMKFDGANNYVEIPHNANQLLTGGFTFKALIKPTGEGEISAGRIIDKGSSITVPDGFLVGITTLGRVQSIIGGGSAILCANNAVPLNKYTRLIVTVAPDGTIYYYINGVLSGTPAKSGSLSAITSTNAIRIGNRATATDRSYKGMIDEPALGNRYITAEEAMTLDRTGLWPEDVELSFEFPFNSITDNITPDTSGNGNDGTVSGAVLTTDVWQTGRNSV